MKVLSFLFTKKKMKGKNGESVSRAYLRWWIVGIIAMVISIGTLNPTQYDFITYMSTQDYKDFFSYFKGLLVLVIWALSFIALYKAVGKWGVLTLIILVSLFFGGIVQRDWLDMGNLSQTGWFVNFALSFIIWFGIMSPRFWKSITGQITADLTEGSEVGIDNEER